MQVTQVAFEQYRSKILLVMQGANHTHHSQLCLTDSMKTSTENTIQFSILQKKTL